MSKRKKYPPIKPQFLKNENSKNTLVILDKKAFESIFEEIKELENKIAILKKKQQLQ